MSKKKIFSILLTVVMVFAFAQGRAIAGVATQVLVELSKKTTNPYDPMPIRGRVLILDADGLLATEFAGSPVNQSKLIIKSDVFGNEMGVSKQQIEVPSQDLAFSDSPLEISLSSAEQEFALSYDNITEIGADKLVVTLKKTNTQFITNQSGGEPPIIIDVTAPPANAYVVRTGGIPEAQLPEVLDTVPPIKKNNDKKLQAGQPAPVDIFAVFAKDISVPADGIAELIFTNNVPEGAAKIEPFNASGFEVAGGDLVQGLLQTSGKLEKINAAAGVNVNDSVAAQLATMEGVFATGKTIKVEVPFPTIRTIGNIDGDVTAEGRLDLQAGNPDSFVVAGDNVLYDEVNYRPAKVSKINLIGLPVTDIGNNLVKLGAELSVKDATSFISDIKAKVTDFKVNGPAGGQIYAALIGLDVYDNLAPFYQDQTSFAGATVAFELMGTGSASPYAGYGSGTSVITTADPLQAFLPIVITGDYPGLYVTKPAAPASPLDPKALDGINTAAQARNFSLGAYVTDVIAQPINVEAGGNDSVQIQVKGSTQENAFTMQAFKASGGAVKVNIDGSDTPKDSVVIPSKEDLITAEQDVSFYTTVQAEPLRLVFTGLSKKTTFIYITAPATIEPADPGDYPPSSVNVKLKDVNIYMDVEERHDEAQSTQEDSITILDAFGNPYDGLYNGSSVYTEDADPIVEVFKSDGTTPFPGADAEIDNDDLVVSFDLAQVTPEASEAIVKVTAGDGSDQVKIGLAALKKTSLRAIYIPLQKTQCPVQINFADQNDKLIPPVVRDTASEYNAGINYLDPPVPIIAPYGLPNYQGAFEIELAVIDGYIAGSGIGEKTILSTNTPYRIFRAQPVDGKTVMTVKADGGDAKAGTTEIVLDFIPDTIKPAVGEVTVDGCTAKIAITDNKAIDCEASTVVVKDGATGPIVPTEDYTKSCTGDGTPAGSIDITPKSTDPKTYTFIVNAIDASGNQSGEVILSATVCAAPPTTTTTVPPESCATVSPATIDSEATVDITITGTGLAGITKDDISFEGCGITVNSATSNSDTEATVNITAGTVECEKTCDATLVLKGNTTSCKITVAGPSTCTPPCTLTVDKTLLPLTAGPTFRIRRIVINGTGSNWGRTSAVSIEDIPIVIPLRKQADKITALIVIPGKLFGRFTPGTKPVTVITGDVACEGEVVIN